MPKCSLTALGGFSILMLLGGCVEPAALPSPPSADSCGAVALQSLVGRPASVLQTMRFGTETRFLRPGAAATADYVDTRLNISIDKGEMITAVACG